MRQQQNDRVVEKVFKILDLFLYNKSVTTKLITEETGMSMRSAQRYLKDSMEFLDIKQNDDKSYTLISKDKLSQYIKRDDSYLTATLLQYAKSMYPESRHDAVERLFNLFNIKNLESAIQVLESSSIDFDRVQSVIADLSYYIKTPMKIQFDYMKGNKENKHKTTSPYKILYYNGFWYLIGCNDNKEIRAYRLDYIENIKPSSDNTKYVELDEKSKKIIENTSSIWFGTEELEVELILDDDIKEYFIDRPIFKNMQILSEKPFKIKVTVYNYMSLYMDLMPYAPHFEIITPEARKYFAEQLLEAYEKNK